MSNIADQIFGAAMAYTERSILLDKIRSKKEQIAGVTSKTCGNCHHWMKTSCIPEAQHNQRPSMNSFACKDFEISYGSERLRDEFQGELDILCKEPAP